MKRLIILPARIGFGALVRHTLGGFLLADLLGRKPVVHWRGWCLYANECEQRNGNAFHRFFKADWFSEEEHEPASLFPDDPFFAQAFEQPENGNKGWAYSGFDQYSLPMDLAALNKRNEEAIWYAYYIEPWEVAKLAPEGHYAHGLGYHEMLFAVAQRHLKVSDHIQDRINSYAATIPENYLAVHFRGTDRKREAGAPSLARTIAVTQRERQQNEIIYLATDEEFAVRKFEETFGSCLHVLPIVRSMKRNEGLHNDKATASVNGEDLLVDAIFLSRARKLICNPDSTVTLLASSIFRSPDNRNDFLLPINPSRTTTYYTSLKNKMRKKISRLITRLHF